VTVFLVFASRKINFSRSKDMKYSNAYNVLPVDIVRIIQEYVNGEYLYILEKRKNKKNGEKTAVQEIL